MRQQRIKKGQERVHIIERWPATAAPIEELILLRGDQVIKYIEIDARCIAFDATKRLHIERTPQIVDDSAQPLNGLLHCDVLAMVTDSPLKYAASVRHFPNHDSPCDMCRAGLIVGSPELFLTEQHVATHGPMNPGQELSALRQKTDGNIALCTQVKERRAAGNDTKADNSPEAVDRNPKPRLMFHIHEDRFAFVTQIRALSRDEQRVQ